MPRLNAAVGSALSPMIFLIRSSEQAIRSMGKLESTPPSTILASVCRCRSMSPTPFASDLPPHEGNAHGHADRHRDGHIGRSAVVQDAHLAIGRVGDDQREVAAFVEVHLAQSAAAGHLMGSSFSFSHSRSPPGEEAPAFDKAEELTKVRAQRQQLAYQHGIDPVFEKSGNARNVHEIQDGLKLRFRSFICASNSDCLRHVHEGRETGFPIALLIDRLQHLGGRISRREQCRGDGAGRCADQARGLMSGAKKTSSAPANTEPLAPPPSNTRSKCAIEPSRAIIRLARAPTTVIFLPGSLEGRFKL